MFDEPRSLFDAKYNKRLKSKSEKKRTKAEAHALNNMLDNW